MPSSVLSTLTTTASGAFFGAALAYSVVHPPAVLFAQMRLQSFHVLKVFLTGSGCSAIILGAFQRLNLASYTPRTPSTINLFSAYDANIIGGLLIGIGMALTGACPGTVLVQAATGVSSGILVLFGALLGGIAWARWGQQLKRSPHPKSTNGKGVQSTLTIQEKLGWSYAQALLAYEVMVLVFVAASTFLGPVEAGGRLQPVVGGLLIGGAQAASLLLTGNSVGVSGAYEEAGRWFWHLKRARAGSSPSSQALKFASGIMLGAVILSRSMPSVVAANDDATEVSNMAAVIGGVLLAFGARMAGGCTSGHGISGMAMMSVASVVTVPAMFVGGMIVRAILG